MIKQREFSFYATVGKRETEVCVTYAVTPGREATRWQPEEYAEVEVVTVEHNGKAVFLSDDEEALLLEEAQERAPQDWAEYKADEADYRYEEYRDRLLEEKWERGA